MYLYLRSKNSKHGAAGTPYYVGKGKKMRAYSKYHRVRPPVDKSMIVFVVQNLSESTAHEEEKRLIALYGRIDNGTGSLRNLTDGGEGQCGRIQSAKEKSNRSESMKAWMKAHPLSKETREKIGYASRGRKFGPHTEEWKAANSVRHTGNTYCKGRILSEEHKQKISEGNRGKTVSEETIARMCAAQKGHVPPCAGWNRGKHISDEVRRKLSESHIGKKQSPETIAKRAASLRGNKMPPRSEQWRAKQREAQVGRRLSTETRAKISLALKGKKLSEEHKNNLRSSVYARRGAAI